jgi:hypothetical protein
MASKQADVSFRMQFPLTTQNGVIAYPVINEKRWDWRNWMEKVDAKEIGLTPSILMIKKYLKRLIVTNKEAVLMQVLSIRGLMQLLMKTRNTDEKWTREEKKEIKRHLKNIAKIIPAVAIFVLPGGSLLLPILAEALDRRKIRRLIKKEDPRGTSDRSL